MLTGGTTVEPLSRPAQSAPQTPYTSSGTLAYEPPERDWTREHVKSGPARIPAFLPYFDNNQNLAETQVMRSAYRKMLADPYVKAALLGKLMGIMAMDLQSTPASDDERDKQISEFVHWNLNYRLTGGIPDLIWETAVHACIDGYSICNKISSIEMRGRWKGKRVLRKLKAKDTNNDLVPIFDEYRNIVSFMGLRYNGGEIFSPEDFFVYTHLPLWGNPTGMSDMRAAYRAYWMVDTVTKLRGLGAHKRALPVVAGEWPHEKFQNALETALSKIESQNWLAVPKDVKLQVLDIAGQSEQFFKSFRDDCVEEIFLSIEGAYLQAMAGGQGKHRGSAKSAENRSELFKWALAESLCQAINDPDTGLIVDLVDWNFAGVEEYPRVTLSGINDEELKDSLDIDKGLQELGWQHDPKDLEERYGRKFAGERPEFLAPKAAGESAPGGDQLGLDDLFGDENEDELQPEDQAA